MSLVFHDLLRLFCLVLALLLPIASYAERVAHLYRATVPVASQSERDRNAGFDLALQEVLIKVSGREDRVLQQGLLQQFPPAEQLIQAFSYRDNPDWLAWQNRSDADAVSLGRHQIQEPLPQLLQANFAAAAIDQRLSALGIPVWGAVRPSILVWAVAEQAGERALLGNADAVGLADNLQVQARQRGLPLFLPSADLQDIMAVSLEGLSELFEGSVADANQRYQPDAVLLVRLFEVAPGSWNATWKFVHRQESISGQRRQLAMASAVSEMSKDVAEYLAQRYAVLKGRDQSTAHAGLLTLEVEQVVGFDEFIKLQRHLERLPPVAGLSLQRVDGTQVVWQIKLAGTFEQLLEHIELAGLMRHRQAPQPLLGEQARDDDAALRLEHTSVERFDWLGGRGLR